MADMADIIRFDLNFLEAFFIGHALSTAVNLLIFPRSSRSIVFEDIKRFFQLVGTVLDAEESVVSGFEKSSVLNRSSWKSTNENNPSHVAADSKDLGIAALNSAIRELSAIHSKIRIDLQLAKRDIAWAVLTPGDLGDIFRRLRDIHLGLRGMTVLASIFEKVCEWRGWTLPGISEDDHTKLWKSERHSTEEGDLQERQEWARIFRNFREPIDEMKQDVVLAFEHVSIVLGLESRKDERKRHATDEETKGPMTPGSSKFVADFRARVIQFHQRRTRTLHRWESMKKIVSNDADLEAQPKRTNSSNFKGPFNTEDQEQLLMILYMQHLFHSLLDSVFALVKFAEERNVQHGKRQLVAPGRQKLRKFIRNILKDQDTSDDLNVGDARVSPVHIVAIGDALGFKRHPEHLPPTNKWQRAGDWLRNVSRFLSSSQSVFGFRVACAVLSVAIVGLLQATTTFFFTQRLLWAMIIIAFSMVPTSGQSFSLLLFRVIGSTTAAVVSIVNWYIVDGRPAGVLVFFYLFTFIEFYFTIKYPRYISVWKVNLITRCIMVGYALQTQKTGVQAPPATNSLHYPIYLIAPYRLACTVAGVFVSFIWTIFPAPITSRSMLRRKLGQSLFLLATYYSSMHATVDMYLSDIQGNSSDKRSPGRRLSKARNKVFTKELTLLASLREHSSFSKYEPTVGGKFPKELYDRIISEIDTMLSYMNLVVHAASITFEHHPRSEDSTVQEPSASWKHNLARLFRSADVGPHNITTLLSLIASSVTNGQPLPPYLEPPMPYDLARQFQKMEPELLSIKYAGDPGYSALAVIEVSYTMIGESLTRLLDHVRELVGEVDFGFKVERNKEE